MLWKRLLATAQRPHFIPRLVIILGVIAGIISISIAVMSGARERPARANSATAPPGSFVIGTAISMPATNVPTRTATPLPTTVINTPTQTATPLPAPATPSPPSPPSPTPSPPPVRRPWGQISNWVYWLEDPDLTAIANTAYQLAVIDYSRDAGPEGEFTRAQIEALRQTPGCQRRVVAYIPIGEAEDYRWYWQPGWQPGNPVWLVGPDLDWPGSYWVQFWHPEWQSIVYAYLDRILAAGFDGVYLDRPDAIEQPYTQRHDQAMVNFVINIARYTRARSPLGEDFGVFPQNAEQLWVHPEYLAVVTGIGIEELYYQATNVAVSETERLYRESEVDHFKQGGYGGLILTVDYTNRSAQINDAYARAARKGYVEYVADVGLPNLRINPGHEPVCR